MINEFNYLTLQELFLLKIKYFNHLNAIQKFKIMWAINKAKKIARCNSLNKNHIHSIQINSEKEGICM